MFNKRDSSRNKYMLTGSFEKNGYDWWWHSLTAVNEITGQEKAFFFEYFICNPGLKEDNAVFGQLPENRSAGKKPSYFMVKAGCWGEDHVQLHRFFSVKETKIKKGVPFSVSASDCSCNDEAICGNISISENESAEHPEWMCDHGAIKWALRADKKIAFNVGYGAGAPFRTAKAFEMYWHADGMKTLYSGEIIFNGEKYIVTPETSYGYADKNWGSNFTSPWVWLSSCRLKSLKSGKHLKNSVFDIGGGRPKIYAFPLERKLLGAFYYEGQELEFNFSKFWTMPKTEFSSEETDTEILWHVRQENRTHIMETEVSCLKSEMLLVNYESPDGCKRHNKLWNGGTGTGLIRLYKKTQNGSELIDEIEALSIGCEYGEYC